MDVSKQRITLIFKLNKTMIYNLKNIFIKLSYQMVKNKMNNIGMLNVFMMKICQNLKINSSPIVVRIKEKNKFM